MARVRREETPTTGRPVARARPLHGGHPDTQAGKRTGAEDDGKGIDVCQIRFGIVQDLANTAEQSVGVRALQVEKDLPEQRFASADRHTARRRSGIHGEEKFGHLLAADEEAHDVIVEGEHHEQQDQHQPDLLSDLPGPQGKGAAKDQFVEVEEKMAAIEDRDGKQVQNAELDAQKCKNREDAGQIGLRGLSGDLHDGDGAADIARRDVACRTSS